MGTPPSSLADRIPLVIAGAIIGGAVWLAVLFFLRWPIVLSLALFGISWFPEFFGWGTLTFMIGGAVITWFAESV